MSNSDYNDDEDFMLGGEVNPDDEVADRDFDLVPNGWYYAECTKVEAKRTAAGGRMATLTFEILDGPHSRRLIFQNYNTFHPTKPDVERISKDQLTLLNRASIKRPTRDIRDYVRAVCWIKVGVERSQDPQFGDKNKVVSYAENPPQERGRGRASGQGGSAGGGNAAPRGGNPAPRNSNPAPRGGNPAPRNNPVRSGNPPREGNPPRDDRQDDRGRDDRQQDDGYGEETRAAPRNERQNARPGRSERNWD
jgi:hypothetical protein